MSDLVFRLLDTADLSQQAQLESLVVERLKEAGREDFFTPLTTEYKQALLSRGDYIAGLWNDNNLVGQMVVEEALFPDKLYENYTKESVASLQISSSVSYYLRNSLMHPDFQGRKALEILFDRITTEMSQNQNYYTVIHPENVPSIRLGKHIGFLPVGTLERKKDGKKMGFYVRPAAVEANIPKSA
jgi:hypothetical protein